MIPPPESAASRERWHAALDEYLARRERIRRLRTELAEARREGKRIRHERRLQERQP